MASAARLDRDVGRIAGAIYGDLSLCFEQPPLMLVPTLTFKVRRALEPISTITRLSPEQKDQLAEDIQVSIVPLLFSLDIEPEVIAEMSPVVKAAARRALDPFTIHCEGQT